MVSSCTVTLTVRLAPAALQQRVTTSSLLYTQPEVDEKRTQLEQEVLRLQAQIQTEREKV